MTIKSQYKQFQSMLFERPTTLYLNAIVGIHSTSFRYTPYIPWEIWLAKPRFHEYAWGRGDQSSSNEIACYNKKLFNLNDLITGIFLLKIGSVVT